MSWLLSVGNDRSSVPHPTPSAYSIVSRSVHSNSIGSVTAPTALGSIAIRGSSQVKDSAFSAINHRNPFPPAPWAGQAIAMRNRSMIWKAAVVLAATVIVGACGGGSPQARSITLTFIRNAQSQADADGVIDTEIPGPSLTAEGKGQAQQVVHQAGHNKFDSIYASAMAEAQQTAGPLASELGKQVEVLNGLQSINAGWYNGKPETMAG